MQYLLLQRNVSAYAESSEYHPISDSPDIQESGENCFHSPRYRLPLQSPGHWSVHNSFPDITLYCSYQYPSYEHHAFSRAFSS